MSDLIERIDHDIDGCSDDVCDSCDLLKDCRAEIERLEGDLQVTRLQRDARMVSEFVVDDAVKAEIERLRTDLQETEELCYGYQRDFYAERDRNTKLQAVADAAESLFVRGLHHTVDLDDLQIALTAELGG